MPAVLLDVGKRSISVAACALLAALLLAALLLGLGWPTSSTAAEPVFAVCELYAPGHFGNSYEVLGEQEMRQVLQEAAWWGFNRYGDWFDMEDCSDPFVPGRNYKMGNALLDRKTTNFRTAQALGMPLDLVLTPNHVYVDQWLTGKRAVESERMFGQLLCPSDAASRAVILRDYEHLFAHLAQSGIRLSYLNTCPYDYGGCDCERCRPWIVTYAQLEREVFAAARKHFPPIRQDMIGWWWQPEEHRLFAAWADQNAPGWLERMFLHLPYGQTQVADVPLPKGCQKGAFVHIGYADQATPRDIYGHLGPVIAAERIEKTVADLKAQGVPHLTAYSEGVFDDVNKALLAGLASGKYASADEVLRAYAQRYFGVDEAVAARWAAWLKAWGRPFEVDTAQSARELAELVAATPQGGWRRQQWERKQQLFALHHAIGEGDVWTPERLACVERFWQVQEQLQRGLWGLAPPRHIFARSATPLPWYPSWAKYKAAQAQSLGAEQ